MSVMGGSVECVAIGGEMFIILILILGTTI